jgi:putative component of membrane protein insertase Oxa1/YidC/SpoIIIJ protein YidD
MRGLGEDFHMRLRRLCHCHQYCHQGGDEPKHGADDKRNQGCQKAGENIINSFTVA